ncbi:Acyltransferase, partial [Oryctes borbonicus]
QESQDCRDNWWISLLYINNYVNEDRMCLVQTWYLSCDFHYFIIAILLVLIFMKNKKLGFALFIVCFVLSIVAPFIIILSYLRPGMLLFYSNFLRDPKAHPDFILTYIKSHTRATAYCVGVIAGYLYYKLKDSEKKLSKWKSHFISIVSIFLILVAFVSGGVLYNPYHKYNAIEHAVFASLFRLPWSFGSIGLLLTASYGHATIIQKFLSWSPFIPLSRLVYAAYLVHLGLQYRALGMSAGAQTFDIYNLIIWTFGDIVQAFAVALILYLLIETPIRKLFKELFMGRRHNAPSQSEANCNGQNGVNTISRRENDSRL